MLIVAPTRAAAAIIGGATIDGALSIHDRISNKNYHMGKSFWQNHLALIIDKISIVSLKLLSIVDSHQNQTKGKIDNDTTVLGGLDLIIVMGDFF